MRRSPIVLGATLVGTAGVLALHPHAATVPPATASTAATASAPTTNSTSTPAANGSGGSSGSGSGSSAGSTGVSGTATGDAIATQYGNVRVQVTLRNGKIVTVQPLQLTGNDPRSAQISADAAPTLKQEALAAQSAAIDAVSGATFTSAGYAQSLQSALDKLGFKAADGSRATLQVP